MPDSIFLAHPLHAPSTPRYTLTPHPPTSRLDSTKQLQRCLAILKITGQVWGMGCSGAGLLGWEARLNHPKSALWVLGCMCP